MTWSVIIPYYNEEAYIADTLRSLVQQSRMPDRMILVDNGSTDRSREVSAETLAPFPEVRAVFLSAPTPGQVHALEKGIAAADTDHVAICDADTFYPAHYIALADHCFTTGGPDLVAVMACYVDRTDSPARQNIDRAHQLLASRILPRQCHVGGAGQSFRTAALKQAGGYAAHLWPYVLKDHELMHRMFKIGQARYHPDLWCAPSPRRANRRHVRWTLAERLLYHATPFALKDWYFYSFLQARFARRSMQDVCLRHDQPNAVVADSEGETHAPSHPLCR